MGVYFGTDGIRGVYGEEISPSIAYSCGNSLARLCDKKKVLIGRDTRTSGDVLSLSFASGLMSAGVSVVDVGITTTPIIAFLTKRFAFDFGVVISASHNPSNFNGIKIFDKYGYKISEETENQIERKFIQTSLYGYENLGRFYFKPKLIKEYKKEILKHFQSLGGLKVVLDCANGASYKIAKELFEKLGANVISINNKNDGININNNCGALYPDKLVQTVLKNNADIGFAFDGDADRIICCDEKGNLIDGDDILYLLSNYSTLHPKEIVGTVMTNKGLEKALNVQGIKLIRADVGDKYVVEKMKNNNILLGGEPSGHIIIHNLATTGDGVLTAIAISNIVKNQKEKVSKLVKFVKFPQVNINVPVVDKFRILNSDKLSKEILKIQQIFGENGRVLVRASGTEPKVRIMCEHINFNTAKTYAELLKNLVLNLNSSQNK